MYQCLDCDCKMDRPQTWTEGHGECLSGCPRCGGAVEELEECLDCGELHLVSELIGGYCQDCYERQFSEESYLDEWSYVV